MSNQAIDFAKEVAKLKKERMVGKNTGIVIWGGQFPEKRLGSFFTAWEYSQMAYRIWEYADHCDFVSQQLPRAEDYFLLERGRIFGNMGDLELRRDAGEFFWHFIGNSPIVRPDGFVVKDFWQENSAAQLREEHGSALLWGDYKENIGFWCDDRVAHKTLKYPVLAQEARKNGQRIQIDYTIFTDGGQVAFVWWKELKKYEG